MSLPCLCAPDLRDILVFRALQVGDLLCAVPALRALRAAQPAARITLVGLPWAAQFASRFPSLVDDFLAFPGHPSLPERTPDAAAWPEFITQVRARRAGLALQLHGSGEASNPIVREFGARLVAGHSLQPERDGPSFVRWTGCGHESTRLLLLVRALGAPRVSASLDFPLREADEAELLASGVTAELGGRDYLCVHAGARDLRRCWPAACFAQVADGLADASGLAVVLTGSGNEQAVAAEVASRMRHPAINAARPISIGAMAALIRRARLMVCNDTGASHLAAALRVPSVVVFGETDIERWGPLDRRRHRCVSDPAGQRAGQVLGEALDLLRSAS